MLERKSTYTIAEVERILKEEVLSRLNNKKGPKMIFDGDEIHLLSDRYKTFFLTGYICPVCGLKATFFAKERNSKDKYYHLNLYGTNNKGQEVLFTKDHIIPKSMGGTNHYSNYQTMCSCCNRKKNSSVKSGDFDEYRVTIETTNISLLKKINDILNNYHEIPDLKKEFTIVKEGTRVENEKNRKIIGIK